MTAEFQSRQFLLFSVTYGFLDRRGGQSVDRNPAGRSDIVLFS